VNARTTGQSASQDFSRKAVQTYEQALYSAPTDEHKADTLYEMSQGYELLQDRARAIETYRVIVMHYPGWGHYAAACKRLGDLYSYVTMAEPGASPQEIARIVKEDFSSRTAREYYEKAVQAGIPTSFEVLSSKAALIALYSDMGRNDLSWRYLDEFAALKVEDVVVPDYMGPYREMRDRPTSTSQRLDLARRHALMCRQAAPALLVRYSLDADPGKSIENLRNLAARYAGTDVEKAALEEVRKIEENLTLSGDGANSKALQHD